MAKRGRRSIGAAPMTVAERQRVERERNRRAREAVSALSVFAFNAVDWEQQRELDTTEILSTILMLSKWAMEGNIALDEWRLTLSPDRLAYTATAFARMNIQLPFCTVCGSELRQDEGGIWSRCEHPDTGHSDGKKGQNHL